MRVMSEQWETPAVSVSRPWWKTFLFGVLLMLVPFVGWSLATHYVMTHDDPAAYAPKKAASAGVLLFVFMIIGYVLVGIIAMAAR